MLLNFPVDKDGLIHPIDSANAVNFHKKIRQELSVNLLKGITPKVDSQQGKHTGKNITDGQYDTFWASKKKKMPISSFNSENRNLLHASCSRNIYLWGSA